MANRADNFNRPDGPGLGTPSDGGTAWTNLAAGWAIESDVRAVANSGTALAVLEASASNVLISATPGIATIGLVCRVTDVDNYIYMRVRGGDSEIRLFRVEGGVSTLIGLYSASLAVVPYQLRCEGNAIKCYENSVERLNVTESFNNTATKHGIHANVVFTTLDDLSITDLGAVITDTLMGQACM